MNATAKQKRRFDKISDLGCLPCLIDGIPDTPATIHHCHNYGYRDHNKVIPLCPAHHQIQQALEGIPNREKNPIEFKKKYGSDSELHLMTVRMLEDKTII